MLLIKQAVLMLLRYCFILITTVTIEKIKTNNKETNIQVFPPNAKPHSDSTAKVLRCNELHCI